MDSLAVVHEDVAACRACPRLVAWREQVAVERRAAYRDEPYWGRGVPGFGDPAARLVVVGLAPAAHGANRTGRMFTGDRSGDWLYRALWRAGFANQPHSVHAGDGMRLRGAYITSPVKCAPPQNAPTPAEVAACRPFLERELALLADVRVFVALGHLAYNALCTHHGVRPRPRFGHGVEVRIDDRRTIVCSYHVSQQNTFTGRLTEPMLDAVFTRARALAGLRPAPASRTHDPQG
jgi:uracil-DNA glycosylase family 4